MANKKSASKRARNAPKVTGAMLRKAAVAAVKKSVSGGFQPLSAKDTKKFQALLAEIGSGKRDGFIFMSTVDGKPTGRDTIAAEGLIFAHNVSKQVVLGNLIHRLQMDPFSVLSTLAQVADAK